jgi:hypothetical protein
MGHHTVARNKPNHKTFSVVLAHGLDSLGMYVVSLKVVINKCLKCKLRRKAHLVIDKGGEKMPESSENLALRGFHADPLS